MLLPCAGLFLFLPGLFPERSQKRFQRLRPGHQAQAVFQQQATLLRPVPFFQQGGRLQKIPVVPGSALMQQGRQIGMDVVQIACRTAAGRFLFIQQLA